MGWVCTYLWGVGWVGVGECMGGPCVCAGVCVGVWVSVGVGGCWSVGGDGRSVSVGVVVLALSCPPGTPHPGTLGPRHL